MEHSGVRNVNFVRIVGHVCPVKFVASEIFDTSLAEHKSLLIHSAVGSLLGHHTVDPFVV